MRLSRRAKRRVIALTCGAGLIITSVGVMKAVRGAQQQRAIAQSLEQGLEAYDAGDPALALETLRVFISYQKNSPVVIGPLLKFADARRRVPKDDGSHLLESRDLYQHARKLLIDNPDVEEHAALLTETRTRLLELYGLLGMRAELLATADQILDANPDDIDALAAKARVLYLARDLPGAETCARKLIALEPDEMTWRQSLLQIRHGMNRSDSEMLAVCDEWIEAWDGDGRMHLLKAGWLAGIGRGGEARTAAVTAAGGGAETLDVLQTMVSLLDLLDLRETATELLVQARSSFPDEQWVREAMVRRMWHVGRVAEGLAEIERTLEEFDHADAGLLRLQAMLLIAADETGEARAVLADLESRSGITSDAGSRAWARAVRLQLDRPETSWRELIAGCQHALSLDPDDAAMHFIMGDAYAEAGADSRAVEAFERAFTLEPNWAAAGTALANAQLISGQPHAAVETMRTLMSRSSRGKVGAYLLLGRCAVASMRDGGIPQLTDAETGRPIDLAGMLETIGEQFPERTDVPGLLAEAYALTNRSLEAMALIGTHLNMDEPSVEVLIDLAGVSAGYGLGAQSGDLLARARAVDGLSLAVARAEAARLAGDGRYEDGLALIETAIADAPLEKQAAVETRLMRASYLVRMEHPDALRQLATLSDVLADSQVAQTYILSLREAWQSAELVRAAIDHLAAIVGPQFEHVRLAEANYMLRFHDDDEAKRAQAIVDIANVLEQSPRSLAALTLMADASLRGPRPHRQRAVEHLRRAVDVAPGRSDLAMKLIALLQQEGDYEAAAQYLNHLSRLARHDQRARRGQLRLLHAQPARSIALDDVSAVSEHAETDAEQLILASLHMRMGDADRAEAVYERLLAGPHPSNLAVAQAADFFARTDRFRRGASLLEEFGEELPPADAALLLGTFHQRHGRLPEAREWLTKAAEADEGRAIIRYELARHYVAAGEYSNARDEALAGLEIDPEHPGLRSTLAMVNMRLDPEAREEALALLRNRASEDDALLDTLSVLNDVPVRDGRAAPGADDLRAAERLIDDHADFLPAWMLAVTLHRDAGETRGAIAIARRAVGRFPSAAGPSEWATRVLMLNGDWDEALVEAEEWRRRVANDTYAVDLASATILIELDRGTDAVARLNLHAGRIVAERERAPRDLVTWIEALVHAGRDGDAWRTLRPIADAELPWSLAWIELATATAADTAQRMLNAIDVMARRERALIVPAASAWSDLGWRSGRSSCFDRADAMLAQARTDRPDANHLFVQGRVAEGRGDLAAAETLYRAALDADANHLAALNNLAYVLASSPAGSREARVLVQRALNRFPDHPDLLDTHARALWGLGETKAARASLDRALRQRPQDIGLRISLAELLVEAGDDEGARRVLRDVERMMRSLAAPRADLERRLEDIDRRVQEMRVAVP